MNVKDSISMSMDSVKGRERKDQSAKRIFSYKPIMSNILKYAVEEYKDCSLEEIMDCIEGDTIQTGTALVEEDMAKTIRGENTELHATDEAPATFDILFRSLKPKTEGKILVNLHIDFEIQKDYRPGYPIVKRGVYYGSRKLSAQLDKIGVNGKGYGLLEKVYSIFICLDNIPKEEQNTISYYKMTNYKNEGFEDAVIEGLSSDADLLEVIIVRLGGEKRNEKGLIDFLYGLFSGNQEKILSYIPDSEKQVWQEEVSGMLSMISYAEENGEKRGEAKLSKLVSILMKKKQFSDVARISEDEKYREEMYKKYNL